MNEWSNVTSNRPLYDTQINYSAGQPSRAPYSDYRENSEKIRTRGKIMQLEIEDKKLHARYLNLIAHDPKKWPQF